MLCHCPKRPALLPWAIPLSFEGRLADIPFSRIRLIVLATLFSSSGARTVDLRFLLLASNSR
jgi:hypothetical protein